MNVSAYSELHKSQPNYGAGLRHYDYVKIIIQHFGFKTALDYGCGKGRMADSLNSDGIIACKKYDPAIKEISDKPNDKFDLIINTDVLEHVPEEHLPSILSDFKQFSSRAIVIPHLGKAAAVLPNGENAHCTIKTVPEWKDVLQNSFKFVEHFSHDSPAHALFYCSDIEFANGTLEMALSLQSQVKRQQRRIKELQTKILQTSKSSHSEDKTDINVAVPSKECIYISECIKLGKPFEPQFLDSTIHVSPKNPFMSRSREFESHISELEYEFGGKPRFLHVHSALIVAIRRQINLEWTLGEFRRLWTAKASELIQMLSLRWLVSATDTFADYPSDECERSVALMVTLFVNTIKLVETERHIEGAKNEILPVKETRGVNLFDGLTAFRIKKGDMLENLLSRMDKLSASSMPCSLILQEAMKRIIKGPTTFSRITKLKRFQTELNI